MSQNSEKRPEGPARVAVLISGRGSNLEALLDRFNRSDQRSARVTLVISDRPGAEGLEKAGSRGVPTAVISPRDYASEDQFGDAIVSALRDAESDLVVLAGFLRKVPVNVVRAYRGRMINIHPALLPFFGGKGMYGEQVHRAVLDSGMKVSGASIHFVDEEYDRGPIIAQWPVPVLSDDTPDRLAGRVLTVEHQLLPAVVERIAEGRIRLEAGKVVVEDEEVLWAGR